MIQCNSLVINLMSAMNEPEQTAVHWRPCLNAPLQLNPLFCISCLSKLAHRRLSRCGFRTDEPNSVSRSGPRRRSSHWAWCRARGRFWEAYTSSRPAWLGSTTPSPCPTSPASLPCCPRGHTPATRARGASAPVPVRPLSRPPSASMMNGTAHWGATSPRRCSRWPPCSLWIPPLTGAEAPDVSK